MTLEAAFLVGLQLLLLTYPVVAYILIRAAVQRPYIAALTAMAVLTVLIALLVLLVVVGVGNLAVGAPVSPEVVRTAFRGVLLALGLFPIWFLWLYRTRRFTDGG